MIRTIIELEEDNILLNNMTKFHKVLIYINKLFDLESGRWVDALADVRTDRRTGVTLNAPVCIKIVVFYKSRVLVLNLLASNPVYKLLLKRLLQCINQPQLCVIIVDKPWGKSWFLSF